MSLTAEVQLALISFIETKSLKPGLCLFADKAVKNTVCNCK